MALIICPECKSEVSDQANACIKCGFPLQGKPKNVMISFPVWKHQMFFNKCKVFRSGKEIAECKLGETVTFGCNDPFEIEVTVGGAFGKPKTTVSPGDRFKVEYRGLGEIYFSKVENIV